MAKANESSFSTDDQPKKGRGICPFLSGRFVVGFGGGRYEDKNCVGSKCAVWSASKERCGLVELP